MTNEAVVRRLAQHGITSDELRAIEATLIGAPLGVLAACGAAEKDVDVITVIAGKIPVRLTNDATTLVARFPLVDRAVFLRVNGKFSRDAILDAVLRGSGPAAVAPILDLATAEGAAP